MKIRTVKLRMHKFLTGLSCITYMGVSRPSLLIESTDSMIFLSMTRDCE